MGRQFRIFLSPQDAQQFEAALLGIEDSVLLDSRSRGPYPKVYEATDDSTAGEWKLFRYIVRRSDIDRVVTKEVPTQGYWRIDGLYSPVIELTRSTVIDGVFAPGRLYYNESYYDETANLARKPDEFCAWAKRLFSKGRRILIYDREREAYFGEEGLEIYKSGIPLRGH